MGTEEVLFNGTTYTLGQFGKRERGREGGRKRGREREREGGREGERETCSCSTYVHIDILIIIFLKLENVKPLHSDIGIPEQRLALHILRQQNIVPEHIEKRTLYNPMYPGISQVSIITCTCTCTCIPALL